MSLMKRLYKKSAFLRPHVQYKILSINYRGVALWGTLHNIGTLKTCGHLMKMINDKKVEYISTSRLLKKQIGTFQFTEMGQIDTHYGTLIKDAKQRGLKDYKFACSKS